MPSSAGQGVPISRWIWRCCFGGVIICGAVIISGSEMSTIMGVWRRGYPVVKRAFCGCCLVKCILLCLNSKKSKSPLGIKHHGTQHIFVKLFWQYPICHAIKMFWESSVLKWIGMLYCDEWGKFSDQIILRLHLKNCNYVISFLLV